MTSREVFVDGTRVSFDINRLTGALGDGLINFDFLITSVLCKIKKVSVV